MTSYRDHLYDQYTTVQTRITSDAELRAEAERHHAAYRATILPHLPASRSARILDLGCGYGGFLLLLQQEGYQHAEGIDRSAEQIERAHRLGVTSASTADILDYLATMPAADCITMIDVIEHLTRDEAITVLTACYHALRPGGCVIMRTPNVDGAFGSVLSYGDLTHELHLNKLSALELMASLPYGEAAVLPVWPTGGSLAVRLIRAIGRPLCRIRQKLQAAVYGMTTRYVLETPNMLIIGRRTDR